MKRLAIFLLFCATAHSQFTSAHSIWNRPVDSAAPTDGYALTWSASQGKYVFSSAAGPAAIVATVNTAASTCTVTGGVGGETCTASPTAGTCASIAVPGVVINHNYGSGTLVPLLGANDSTGDEFGGQPTTSVCGVKATTTNSVTISLSAASGAGAQFRITNAQSGPIGPIGPTGPAGGVSSVSGTAPVAVATGASTPVVSLNANGITSSLTAVVNTRRVCIYDNDTQSATVLTAAQITGRCDVPAASHIVEIRIRADTGTPSALIEKWHCSGFTAGNCTGYTKTDMLSATLPAITGGFNACAMTSTAQTCIDGSTSSASITVAASGVLAAADIINVKSAVITGSPTWVHIEVIYTID